VAFPKVSRCSALAGLLDAPEIDRLVAELQGTRWTGRPGYPLRAMVGMALAKSLYAIPTWTRMVALVREHSALAAVIAPDGDVPSVYACYRFTAKLRDHAHLLDGCIARVLTRLKSQHPDMGEHIAIDASDLPAYANGQRFVSKGGREREKFSDPEASWGHRSAVSTRKGGGFYGYRLHAAVCTTTGLPLAWEVRSARENELPLAMPLLDRVRARHHVKTTAMDKGYDQSVIYEGCQQRGAEAIVPLKRTKHAIPECKLRTPRDERWRKLYKARGAVEREFGRLKHEWAMLPLRVRGLARVALHVNLTILTKLGCVLLASQ
jgi:Transposase DDE domain